MIKQFFNSKNVKHIFGYSGGANLPLLNELYSSDIEFIVNRNEQCGGHSATGYAKIKNEPGVIVTTSGPGVTNLITPLQDAKNDGVPLFVLTGQVPTNALGTDAFQESDAISLTKACTKWNYQLKHGDTIDVLEKAWNIATSDRSGPVHIDIPKDIQLLPSYSHKFDVESERWCDPTYYIDVNSITELLSNSKKPIIIAGKGCNTSSNILKQISEKYKIPVTTTLHGMGSFDETLPLSLKMLGMHGSAYANFAVQESDLIIGIGCRFDDRITGNLNGFAPNANIIHVDNDIKQSNFVNKQLKKSKCKEILSVQTNAKHFLETLLHINSKLETENWLKQIDIWKNKYPFQWENTNNIKNQDFLSTLDNYMLDNNLHHDSYFTTGVGNHQMMSAQFITWRHPSILTSGSLGVMGVGLPYAIGAQIAKPDKNIILIDGDGSFNMTLNDLATVSELNLPIKMFVFNDQRLQMVHVWQDLFFDQNYLATSMTNPDYCMIAEAHGIPSLTCDKKEDMKSIIDLAFQEDGPMLINILSEPDYCFPLVAPGKNLDEMILNRDDISKMNKNVLPPS